MGSAPKNLNELVASAVAYYWKTREKQAVSGSKDQGARSAVTGGAHMDGFIELTTYLLLGAGVKKENIFYHRQVELPGFFRPTKEWDLLVIKDGQLVIAIETKSQVGPSFGNNFNNRTEEAMGSALDLWTAYREGAYNKTIKPWLGYFFLLEDCPGSRSPVAVKEPHFKVFPEFRDASYAKRYEIFCRRLVRENHYNAAAFLLSDRQSGLGGEYAEPASDLAVEVFARSIIGQASAFGAEG
ncbi:MAG: PaeR7I family type II restriction endonuclease [Patescibacteria group bacterium]